MIVRREKRRRNYTICPNEIFEVGLKPEDVGFLTHLLSRPDDWKVFLKALSKHWDIGSKKTERIINDLIAAGYIKRTRIRDPETNQFVGIEYVVFEERQPPGDGEVDPAKSSGNTPHPENPVVAEPHPEKPRAENPGEVITTDRTNLSPKKGSFRKTSAEPGATASMALEKEKGERPAKDAPPFETFEDAWQWALNDDRVGARRAFSRLTNGDRWAALTGITAFQASVEAGAGRTVQAKRYLLKELWKNRPCSAALWCSGCLLF